MSDLSAEYAKAFLDDADLTPIVTRLLLEGRYTASLAQRLAPRRGQHPLSGRVPGQRA